MPQAARASAAVSSAAAAAASRHGLHSLSVNKPVLIGSSTGGTQALEMVLSALPADAPSIAIVQHMPEKFTAMYAERMDGICAMNIREARDGDRLERSSGRFSPTRLI